MPQPPNQGIRASQRPGGTLFWHHAWTAVFAANLVIPISFATELPHHHREVGKSQEIGVAIAMAIAILWLLW